VKQAAQENSEGSLIFPAVNNLILSIISQEPLLFIQMNGSIEFLPAVSYHFFWGVLGAAYRPLIWMRHLFGISKFFGQFLPL
jgi:hypothetical protein